MLQPLLRDEAARRDRAVRADARPEQRGGDPGASEKMRSEELQKKMRKGVRSEE